MRKRHAWRRLLPALAAALGALVVVAPIDASTAPTPTPALHTTVQPPAAPVAIARPLTAQRPRTGPTRRAAPDRLVVTFTSRAAGRLQSPAINARLGATTLHSAALGRVQVVQVDPGRRDSLISAYSTQPGVQGVSLDRAVSVMETPTDPEYSFDTGFGYTDGWSLDAIHAPTAWNLSHGDGVRVAVLDTGIWKEHPDLAGQVVDEQDFTSSATGAADAYGHGTHVAGIIAAVENDATGSAGVAPRAKLLNGKVLGDDGSGWESDSLAAIEWAAQQGARVINLSIGGAFACPPEYQAAIDDAWNAGAVIVAAAGNYGDGNGTAGWDTTTHPTTPASCNHVISVAASTIGGPTAPGFQEHLASFSNYGANVTLTAPGQNVLSTMLTSSPVVTPMIDASGYGAESGTSMAAPQVSGVAALVWATQYGTDPATVLSRISTTADDLGNATRGVNWTYGRVNAASAVGAANPIGPAQVRVGLGPTGLPSQPSTTQISANWTPVSGAAGYQFAIGNHSGTADVVNWTDNNANLAMTQQGLSLINGQTYYVTVRAYDQSATPGPATSSAGVRVLAPSVSPPTAVYDGLGADIDQQSSTTQISANWPAVQSAVGYELAVGSTTDTNTLGWTNVGDVTHTTQQLTLSPLSAYHVSVRAYDGAGNRTAAVRSNGVRVLPAPTAVYDGGLASELSYQASAGTYSLSFSAPAVASTVELALGTAPGQTDVLDWIPTDGSPQMITRLGLTPGVTYYGAARARYSDSQVSTSVNTTGTTVMSPPTSVLVSWTSATTLTASWPAVTGAAGYEYAIGTSAGAADVLDWTAGGTALTMTRGGLSPIANQSYYVSVRAFDAYGLSGMDNRTVATTSPPIPGPAPAPTPAPTLVPTVTPTDPPTVVPTSQPTATPAPASNTSRPRQPAKATPVAPGTGAVAPASGPNAMPLVYPVAKAPTDQVTQPTSDLAALAAPSPVTADPSPPIQPPPGPVDPVMDTALLVPPSPAWRLTGVSFDVVNDPADTELSPGTPAVVTVRPAPDTLLAAEADLGRFVLAWYDATTAAWQILPTTVNADGTLSAESDHPGPLALLEAITAPPEPDSSDIPVAED